VVTLFECLSVVERLSMSQWYLYSRMNCAIALLQGTNATMGCSPVSSMLQSLHDAHYTRTSQMAEGRRSLVWTMPVGGAVVAGQCCSNCVALADIIPSLIQLLIQFHDTLVTIACLSLLPFIEYRKQGDSSHYLHTRMPLWALERCRCELS